MFDEDDLVAPVGLNERFRGYRHLPATACPHLMRLRAKRPSAAS
jgi:hypothetical protein